MTVRRNPRSIGLALAAATVAAIPAGAIADSIGPHASFYSTVSPRVRHAVFNAVTILVHRPTGRSVVNVSNRCLGTFTIKFPGQPSVTDAKNATITPRLRRGRLSFRGRAKLIAGQNARGSVRMTFNATVSAQRATGSATFPGTRCGQIRFRAPLRERTR